MAGAREVKSRIASVRETKKLTDAMYMISSVKMRRALRATEETSPYFEVLAEKIGELLHYIPQTQNRYFSVSARQNPHIRPGVLLITADKGLAGAYNQGAIRICKTYLEKYPNAKVFILGEYGRQHFLSKNIPFVQDFRYSASVPTLTNARKICMDLLEYYDEKKVDEISVIYTDYVGAKPGECRRVPLLPLEKTTFPTGTAAGNVMEKEFLPSPDQVLEGIVPSYLMGFIYGCLVESYCSEQQARMIAMKSASDNAEKMLKTLQLQYNKIRQASITNEMIEITAGARALKRRGESAAGDIRHEDE